MSAADIGRRKVEEREAEYVAVGDVIVDPRGRDLVVTHLGPRTSVVRLVVEAVHGKGCGLVRLDPHTLVRVRR